MNVPSVTRRLGAGSIFYVKLSNKKNKA